MKAIETGVQVSNRGRLIQVRRYRVPDSTVRQVEIRYHMGGIGRVVYYPDVMRCWKRMHKKINYFLHDRDSLGKPIARGNVEALEKFRADKTGVKKETV